MLTGWVGRWREQAPTSEARRGGWASAQARRLRYRFARRHWKVLLVLAAIGVGTSPAFWLLPNPGVAMFGLGAWTATWIALIAHFVDTSSGSSSFMLGELGERWTADATKGLAQQGWRVMHHALLAHGDIDTVLIGPGGVVVVETKNGTSGWSGRRQEAWINSAAQQAADNARKLRLFLRRVIGDAPVRAVVALWPSGEPGTVRIDEVGGVVIRQGLDLRAWLDSLPQGALTAAQIAEAWELLSKHVVKRDAYELSRHGPPPRSVNQYAFDTVKPLLGFLVGLLAFGQLLRIGLWPAVVISLLGAAAAARAMAAPRLHAVAAGFVVAVGTCLVFMAALTTLLLVFA